MSETLAEALDEALKKPDSEPELVSWEDDETSGTLFLRAGSTLACGALLLWAQRSAPIAPGTDWGRWIWAAVLCNLLLPLGVVWLFFAQSLTHLAWLKDQKYNAWSYGWNFAGWKRHLKITFVCLIVMLPLMLYYVQVPGVRNYYLNYFPLVGSTPALFRLLATTALYMLCWEWFFRGFLLFGMAQGFGFVLAIALQAGLFGLAHWNKPPLEMYSSFVGGALLGVLCWREKSFAPAFYIHALIHLLWIVIIVANL